MVVIKENDKNDLDYEYLYDLDAWDTTNEYIQEPVKRCLDNDLSSSAETEKAEISNVIVEKNVNDNAMSKEEIKLKVWMNKRLIVQMIIMRFKVTMMLKNVRRMRRKKVKFWMTEMSLVCIRKNLKMTRKELGN